MQPTNPFALDAPPAPPVQPQPAPVAAPIGSTQTTYPPFAAPAPVAPTPPVDPFGGADPFGDPAPQAPRGPRLRDIYGRLVLLIPHSLERGVPNRLQPGTTQDRMTADVIVLDGGPIAFGGEPEKVGGRPHDKTANPPHKTARQFISSTGLISQCREALEKHQRGEPGMVLGRLTTGRVPDNGGNPPWLLTPATDADKALARQYLAQVDPFA